MKTSQPFRNFTPNTYIRKRYAPILATFVEPSVDSFVKQCGFSFIDILASYGSKLRTPIRIYPFEDIKQRECDDFLNQTLKEIKQIGDIFLTEEFEKTGQINNTVGPFPNLLPQVFNIGCKESKYPPWYRILLYRLLESLLFSDFDFIDLPVGILYVTSFQNERQKVEVIRQNLLNVVPEWMQEFLQNIPVICLIVGDGINAPIIPDQITGLKEYQYFTSLNFLSLNGDKVDEKQLNDFFGWDNEIMCNLNFPGLFSQNDISSIEKAFIDITNYFVNPEVCKLQKYYETESERLNKLSKTIQTWLFKKGEPEAVSKYQNIPIKKIMYLQHGAYSMMMGNFVAAQRSYRYFLQSLYPDEIPYLQNRVSIHNLICELGQQGHFTFFIDDAKYKLENPSQYECIRTGLVIPLLAIEFTSYSKEWSEAVIFCKYALGKVNNLYRDIPIIRKTFMAILFERLAGLEARKKHRISYRSMAAYSYKEGNQKGHAIRCFLWLLEKLPEKYWNRLWQTVALEKAAILSDIQQNNRSLKDCANLMALSNMSDDLQHLLLAQFLTTFMDKKIDLKFLSAELKPLLYVKKVILYDPSQPEFYGYTKNDFAKIVDHFNRWFNANISRSSSVSFEEIWDVNGNDSNNETNEEQERLIVSVGSEILIDLVIMNCHAFTIHLNESTVGVRYEGQEKLAEDHLYAKNTETHIDIPGSTISSTQINFKVTPYAQGKYIVDRLLSNYWGYINSTVDFKPVIFAAHHDFPRLQLTVIDLPEKVIANQCIEFSLCVENKGSAITDEFRVLCDPFLILEEGNSEISKHVQIITISEPLNPLDSSIITFILHIPDCDSLDLLFVIDVNGIKVAYQKQRLEIEKKSIVEVQRFEKPNETTVRLLKINFSSENGKFVSIMKRSGSLIKTIVNKTEYGNVIFACLGHKTGEVDEEWRSRLLKKGEIGILYEIEENSYLAQLNIPIPQIVSSDEQLHFKLEIENNNIFRVRLLKYTGSKLYIEPMPIKMETVANDSAESIACCSWTGKRRQLIGNDLDATFRFVANRSGIARIDGFKVSEKRDFSSSRVVSITYSFEISV